MDAMNVCVLKIGYVTPLFYMIVFIIFFFFFFFSGLWGIVNNAGIAGNTGPCEWLTLEDYRNVFNVNLLGLIDVTNTFLPLVKKEKGRIVNMASVMGRISFQGMTPYCISKYGVESFSDSIR